ncbi:serendipity locus protein alpha [Vanessa cardui]|uniref:serendipity locus protein alpha n=1 Tax=Vanessa cardui TaxID=171605 RepID=UPI001F13A259|nr:serendipity locus protein alpha [Vanessa cardui]
METNYPTEIVLNFAEFPKDSRNSIKFIVDILFSNIYPLLQRISDNLHNNLKEGFTDENYVAIRNIYTLCSDQIRKCYLSMLEIIKSEYNNGVYLQESRRCICERLSWCYQKLLSIEQLLEETLVDEVDSFNNSILIPTMYFVNWIDQTFEVLNKLSGVIYQDSFKKNEELHTGWKQELLECIRGLHTSIDELLLSSMTLCKYCLPDDQHIVKARCQVVLRETKSLLSELIDGNLEDVQPTIFNLKLPIMPSNVNLLIDVLKDVLYSLETNTNTALLALVVHCFSQSMTQADMLKCHFEKSPRGECSCQGDGEDVDEKCSFIKEFDLHNERLLQIGSFAMSCSSDQKRILCLRSGLASLEALDPHLVPAVMLSPCSHHSSILVNIWNQEVMQIRDSVFLIVDPAAFADKARQMMHQKLLEITKGGSNNNSKTCAVINIGSIVYDFFNVYEKFEPDALTCQEQLSGLLMDLNKVQMECKVVSNLLSSADDHIYDINKAIPKNNAVSIDQLIKRLKLLYTLVKRITNLLNPKENDDEFYEDPIENKNVTQTINFINGNTYINSPKKQTNITRSMFARSNIRSSTGKFPLAVLTKHLKSRNSKDLSFSIQFDELCNLSEIKMKNREMSILYSPFKPRASLRKAVLSKLCAVPFDKEIILEGKVQSEPSFMSEKDSFMDDNTSLQITDVLNQINDLTNMSTNRRRPFNSTVLLEKSLRNCNESRNNVLKLAVNNESTFKRIWNISINNSAGKQDETACTSNLTQPSDVNTLERLNDLDLVESKLSDLKFGHFETSL